MGPPEPGNYPKTMNLVTESIEYHFGHLPTSLLMSWLAWVVVIDSNTKLKKGRNELPTWSDTFSTSVAVYHEGK